MINHMYTVLYNLTVEPPSGILVRLDQLLSLPDLLSQIATRLGGQTSESRDEFAIKSLKIVDGSSYRQELTKYDSRLTYDLHDYALADENAQPFMSEWMGLGPSIVNQLVAERQDLRRTYKSSRLTQEATAALIIGYVDQVTAYNV